MAKKRKQHKKRLRNPVYTWRRGAGARQGYFRLVADAGVFCLIVLIGCAGVFAYFAQDLPDTRVLWQNKAAPTITLLAADGSPIQIHGISAGTPIRLADLPAHVPQAILAVEDRNFYHHFGMNPVSVMRALLVNTKNGSVVQGGSTITQQLAKNVFLNSDRTVKRKAQELILAIWLEQQFTKEEILTLYLNRVYFGAGAYGIDAASYRYFGKSAHALKVGEAAILAGLLKAPSRLAPTSHPKDAGRRGRLVIDQMVAAGFLEPAQAAAIVKEPIFLATPRFSAAPYFVDYVLQKARALSGGIDADLIVRTTFDPKLQAAAELGLGVGLAREGDKVLSAQSAAVIVDGDGAVRAMIGGKDYRVSQFNRAVQARRQPGSAFKPFVFLAAMERGYATDDMVLDAPIRIGSWSPDNYASKYYGEVSLNEALLKSLNGATIRVQETVGRDAVRRVARAMGWEGKLNPGPALGLGVDAISPLDLAGVYAPFANGGYRVELHAIAQITTTDGDVIYDWAGPNFDPAVSPEAIGKVNHMMRSVVAWGTGRAAAVDGYEVAGKTGTTQGNRDGWFAGHAGGLVGVVWVGRDDNTPMPDVTGGRAPAIIWHEMMVRALPPRYVEPIVAPDHVPVLAPLVTMPEASESTHDLPTHDLIADLLNADS